MFDGIQVTINDVTVTGWRAVVILLSPVLALIFLGIMIGSLL